MEFITDLRWRKGCSVAGLLDTMKSGGFQGTELFKASEIMQKMWAEKAKVILAFTSNMVTSGLRGLFAQMIELGLVSTVITTAGSVEEDIMKANGEKFPMTRFSADDIELHEKGHNRIGNIVITTDSYMKFEGLMKNYLDDIVKEKKEMTVTEFLKKIGAKLKDNNSILRQAYLKGVPVFCPAITDGAIGFHLYMAKDRHPDFRLDVINDFKELITVISPGGGVSKHFALLSALINGGADYAVYMTTSTGWGGSLSGASTNEAKSWGKIKDDSDSVTVIGDVSINFPIAVFRALDKLEEGK
jgi:deoxyhypusine synthase